MAYHTEFWLGLAAAAPVVGLALAVSIGRNTPRIAQAAARRKRVLSEWNATSAIAVFVQDSLRARTVRLVNRRSDLRDRLTSLVAERNKVTDRELREQVDNSIGRLERQIADIDRDISDVTREEEGERIRLGELGRVARRFSDARSLRRAAQLGTGVDILVIASWLLATSALAVALLSLALSRDALPPQLCVGLVVLPMLAAAGVPVAEQLIDQATAGMSPADEQEPR